MRGLLKKAAEQLAQTFTRSFHSDPRRLRDQLTLSLVDAYLREPGRVHALNNPFHSAKLCFELFAPLDVTVQKVKWNMSASDESALRFSRLCAQLDDGIPSYNAQLAKEILDYANTFAGMTDDMPTRGFDISRHFLIASSFAPKGKLLFNVVRFMRPAVCLEVGTAWGMSAYFTMQGLELFSMPGHLWTVEMDDLQFQRSKPALEARFGARVHCVHGASQDCLPAITREVSQFGMYFHDGGHEYDNIVRNFEQVRGCLRRGSVVLIDDIRWWDKVIHKNDPRCYEAWQQIAQDPMVSCAVELNESVGLALIG